MMGFHGSVEGIFVTPTRGEQMEARAEVRAVPDKGLQGDRYYASTKPTSSTRELTLIEAEAIEGLARDHGIELGLGDARRNIVTRGVPLNHLVGKRFTIGNVAVEGVKLCEPCAHLQSLTQKGVLKGLVHRGGLRARILHEGPITVGDAVTG